MSLTDIRVKQCTDAISESNRLMSLTDIRVKQCTDAISESNRLMSLTDIRVNSVRTLYPSQTDSCRSLISESNSVRTRRRAATRANRHGRLAMYTPTHTHSDATGGVGFMAASQRRRRMRKVGIKRRRSGKYRCRVTADNYFAGKDRQGNSGGTEGRSEGIGPSGSWLLRLALSCARITLPILELSARSWQLQTLFCELQVLIRPYLLTRPYLRCGRVSTCST
jgi:hypothetical protein